MIAHQTGIHITQMKDRGLFSLKLIQYTAIIYIILSYLVLYEKNKKNNTQHQYHTHTKYNNNILYIFFNLSYSSQN
jgi:hypothetical protein